MKKRCHIQLEQTMVDRATALGEGNLSKCIRDALAAYQPYKKMELDSERVQKKAEADKEREKKKCMTIKERAVHKRSLEQRVAALEGLLSQAREVEK